MKKWPIVRIAGIFVLVTVLIFLAGLIYLRYIEAGVFSAIKSYSYAAIFIAVFVVDVLPQPLGPEVGIVAANLLSLSFAVSVALTIIASTLAGIASYYIGHAFYHRICYDRACIKYKPYYDKYGEIALLLSALTPLPYNPFCWISGAFGMPLRNFTIYALIPRALRILVFSLALYYFVGSSGLLSLTGY